MSLVTVGPVIFGELDGIIFLREKGLSGKYRDFTCKSKNTVVYTKQNSYLNMLTFNGY